MDSYTTHPATEYINRDQLLVEAALLAQFGHKEDDEYHNYGHPLDAILYAFKEINEYEFHEEAISLRDKRNLVLAYLFHDYAVNLPLDKSVFPTVEERSVHYTEYFLNEFRAQGEDVTTDDIRQISRLILVTNPQFPCENDLERIFCRGDIGNVADSLHVFFVNFIAVYRETQKKRLKERNFKDLVDPFVAADGSVAFLNQYFRQDLTIGTGDWDKTADGTCRFVARALKNFLELPGKIREVIGDEKTG